MVRGRTNGSGNGVLDVARYGTVDRLVCHDVKCHCVVGFGSHGGGGDGGV